MDGTKPVGEGCIRHFALSTDDVDEIVERVRNAGYKVSVDPKKCRYENRTCISNSSGFY